jgi:NCAIR mutase (PurE)-related protein
MNTEILKQILENVKSGRIETDTALQQLRRFPFEDIGFAKIDHHRQLRQGFPEVIFCSGKTAEQITEIARCILKRGSNLLATRVTPEAYQSIKKIAPKAQYNSSGKTVSVVEQLPEPREGILVVTGGTSDIPVAEEAVETAQIMGNKVERLYDVGVAGLHRLLGNKDHLFEARVIIVIAGMEGALASVVGGLVDKPVIAVPTSIGYGASFGGIAALLSMLNTCASGVSVVNIDNGFGAGYTAALINRLGVR